MKISFSLFVFAAFLFFGCQQKTSKKKENESSPVENLLKYSTNLRLYDYGDIIKFEILNSESQQVVFKSELVRNKKLGNQNTITIPLRDIAALSATQLGMFVKLHGQKNLCASTNRKYIYDDELKYLIKHKKIKDISTETGVFTEELIASGAKYVLYDDYGTPFTDQDKLKQLSITCIPISDWQEQHPLGKAEWILLYGYLIGKEKQAKEIFASIEKQYLELKSIAEKQQEKPSVISGNLIGDVWYAPSEASYNATLIRDASGSYVYNHVKSTKPSIEKSMEEILSENQTTQYWLNPGFSTKKELSSYAKKTTLLPAFKKGKIYCYSHNMNLFWERSASEPHHVLEDLIRIFHPNALPKGSFHFYQKLN